jgi:predicted GIY-YIG superfamily endonuclease
MKNPNTNYTKIVTVVTYNDTSAQKELIFKENIGKSGIYLWTNKVNGKSYIGSSVDLTRRLRQYYGKKILTCKYISLIYQALSKHGHDKFSLGIIEYCEAEDLIKREQYYLDLLKPEYNIHQVAGSPLGHKYSEYTKKAMRTSALGRLHSMETRDKIAKAGIGRIFSEESRAKIGVSRLGCKHTEETKAKMKDKAIGRKQSEEARQKIAASRTGRKHTEETKAKMRSAAAIFNLAKGKAVQVIDTKTGLTENFSSKSKAAIAMGVSVPTITNYIKTEKVLEERFILKIYEG